MKNTIVKNYILIEKFTGKQIYGQKDSKFTNNYKYFQIN